MWQPRLCPVSRALLALITSNLTDLLVLAQAIRDWAEERRVLGSS